MTTDDYTRIVALIERDDIDKAIQCLKEFATGARASDLVIVTSRLQNWEREKRLGRRDVYERTSIAKAVLDIAQEELKTQKAGDEISSASGGERSPVKEVKEPDKADEAPLRPVKTNGTGARRRQSIIVGAVSISVVLAIILLKKSLPPQLAGFLQVMFALGCAGISAALLGTITVNLTSSRGISAVGGLGVFVLVLFSLPHPLRVNFLWISP